MISVIIPAHQEEHAIGPCLDALLQHSEAGEFEVVIVCNGCTDRTAQVSRSYPGVRVVETAETSKSRALNLGDDVATTFPRIYLDADVQLPTIAARAIASALSTGLALAASTNHRFDMTGVPRRVRHYYSYWSHLPVVQEGMLGSGVYAVSRHGFKRRGPFPDLIADDAFVHHRFGPDERLIVATDGFVVRPPRTLRALVARKARVFQGNRQLRHLAGTPPFGRSAWLRGLRSNPRLVAALPVFLYVSILAKMRAAQRARRGSIRWGQDRTSRER